MGPLLKFLRFSSGENAEKDLEIIDKAADYAQSNQIEVEIIRNPNDIKALLSSSETTDIQSIYICFPFEGKFFENFKQKGYRIIGPQCVLSCLLLEIPVPKQTYPICNVAMLGVVACCSSMKKEERLKLHESIKVMGGDVTADFTTAVTHLIAKEVGSKKYQVACNNKVPVVLPEWIPSTSMRSKYEHVVASDENIIKEFLLPIFKGCTICVTGIDVNTRDSIKTLVQKNGGVYSGELNMKTCTHLLVEHARGQKYTYARQWKLHCVSPEWFYNCLKKGHWLDEKLYVVEPGADTTVNTSSINQKSHIQNTFRESLMPMDSSSATSSKVAELAAKSLENSKLQKLENIENASMNNDIDIKIFDSNVLKLSKFECQEVDSFYLDGCKIYLCNKAGPILDACRKIINSGGGIRFSTLSDSITHIVLWDQVPVEVKMYLQELDGPLPHVVSPLWLINSCKSTSIVDETEYSLLNQVTSNNNRNAEDVFVKPDPKPFKPTVASSLHINFEDEMADDDTLLNQYVSNNHESTRLSQVEPVQINNNTVKDNDETVTMEETVVPVLKDKTFSIQRFEPDQLLHVKNLIQEFSGSVVEEAKLCDYIIVPLSYSNKKVKVNKKEVTLCWLEQCIEQEEIKKPSSSFLFHPIYVNQKTKPLENCVITISQYSGMERQHLFHLAELLGAVGQDYFVRNETSTMKASTHLILSKPEGSKYTASLKWGVPCISKNWLFKCAKSEKRLPEAEFPVTEGSDDDTILGQGDVTAVENASTLSHNNVDGNLVSFDLSTRGASLLDGTEKSKTKSNYISETVSDLNQSIKENAKKQNSITDFSNFNESLAKERANQKCDHENVSATIDGKEVENVSSRTPLSVKEPTISVKAPLEMNKSRYSFDFTDALDSIQSPAVLSQDSRRKSRRSRGSLPFDVQFAEAIQRAVDKHVPEEDRKAWDCQEEKQINSEGILNGTVIAVSKKLANRQLELHQLVNDMGGETRFMYDNSCTHFIHQGRINDTAKDYSDAKRDKKFLVSPYWLEACAETNTLLDEGKYPVTFNPRLSIDVSSSRTTRSKGALKQSPVLNKLSKKPSPKNDEPYNPPINDDADHDETTTSTSEGKLDFQRKMEEIMEATKAPRSRRTRRQTGASISKNDSGIINPRKLRSRTSSQKSNDSSRSSASDPSAAKTTSADHLNEQSQGDYITYDDPTGRKERERILAQIKQASPSQDVECLQYAMDEFVPPADILEVKESENEEKVEPGSATSAILPITKDSLKPEIINLLYDENEEEEKKKRENSKKYKFLLSGMTAQDKIEYGAIIEKLGGVLFDVQYFNTQCSHVVISAPSRNEKYLATVACGKWALHKSYLEASREQNQFVNEEEHEWGSQSGTSDFAAAAKRWRIELNDKSSEAKSGAFVGWVVLLCIEPSKQPGFKRILEAGGAKVLHIRPPFENIDGVTHAFIGDKKQAVKHVDFNMLHEAGIWILKPEYISDYLTVYPKPPIFNYIIEEVKNLGEKPVPTPVKRKAIEHSGQAQKRTRR